MTAEEKTPQQQQASKDILKAVLTWSHVITVSILLLAAIHNIGGLAVILFKPKIAESVINYTRVWQTFFTIDKYLSVYLQNAPSGADYGIWVPGIGVLIENALAEIDCWPWLTALVVDGIVGGVGAVLGFVPQIFVLFIILSFLFLQLLQYQYLQSMGLTVSYLL